MLQILYYRYYSHFNRSLHAYIIKKKMFSVFKFLTCVGENVINNNYQKLFRFYNGTN